MRNRTIAAIVAAALLVGAVQSGNGARLTLAFHDRADPNPHQVQVAAEAAGMAVALLVTWTERRRAAR